MAPTIMDVHRILVTLSETDLVVEPGNVAQLVVTMTNQQETPDRLLLEVEGIDVEWYMIPVPAVNVAPGAQASERILFKVARSSGNRAGSYPFLVRVLAMETGAVGVAQATLEVKPFSALQAELSPKRGVASFFHPINDFDYTIANLGNIEETLELYASDPEDGCAYEFDMDRVTLKPGQSEMVPLVVRPKSSSIIGGARLYGFTASARSVEDAYISANAHGQIEKRALISPLLGIFLLLLGFGGLAALLLRPAPPQKIAITRFDVDPKKVTEGQQATLTWEVTPNTRMILRHRVGQDGIDIADPEQPKSSIGSLTVTPQYPSTTYIFEITHGDNQQIQGKGQIEKTVLVKAAPKPKQPVIAEFTADPMVIHQGEPVTLKWSGTNTTGFILDPGNYQLSQFEQTKIITPDQDIDMTLRALGKNNDMRPASRIVHIHVVPKDVCIAKIQGFAFSPKLVYIGDRIRLRWKTRYARDVRIDRAEAGASTPIGSVRNAGSLDVTVTEDTTFTLTATDSLGLKVTQQIVVHPTARPLPPPQPVNPPVTDPNAPTTPPTNGGETTPSGGTAAPPPGQ